MRARQITVIVLGMLLVGGTLLFPPDASWQHGYRFSSTGDGDIAGADRLFQLLILEVLFLVALFLAVGTRWRMNVGQHLALWAAIGFVAWIYLMPYPYATLYYRLYEERDGALSVGVLPFLNYCLVIAIMAGILIGTMEIARRMKAPSGNRFIRLTLRQRQTALIGLALLGISAFFPRNDYERVYLVLTPHTPYHAYDLVPLWITGGLAIAVVVWSLREDRSKLSNAQRWVAWTGLGVIMLNVLFPPAGWRSWYNDSFLFTRIRYRYMENMVNVERLVQLEVAIAIITVLLLRIVNRAKPLNRVQKAIQYAGIIFLVLHTYFGFDPLSWECYMFREDTIRIRLVPIAGYWLATLILTGVPVWWFRRGS